MAQETQQILGLGSGGAPLQYVVTGGQVLDLIAVQADYDGSGASGNFLPVVEILSDAGELMARGVGRTVVAGDSVSVTFAPFLEDPNAGSSGSTLEVRGSPDDVVNVTEILFDSPFQVFDDGGGVAEIALPAVQSEYFAGSAILHLAATASAAFPMAHGGGSTLLNYSTPTAPTVIKTGTYAITCEVTGGSANFPDYFDGSLAVQTTFAVTMFSEGRGISPQAATPYMRLMLGGVWPMTAGDSIALTVLSETVGTTDFTLNNSTIVKLS